MRILFIFFMLVCSTIGSAQSWLQRADFGSTGRHRATGFSIGNKGYAGLGHVNGTGQNIVYKDWWQYDPSSNSWTQKADYVSPSYGTIAFGTSTKGYVGGGTAYNNEFFEYNPTTNSWQAITNCPILNATDQSAFAINEKGYVLYGNQCAEFDPITNSWTIKATIPGNLNIWGTSFVVGSSAFVKNGTALYEFKPAQNQWLIRAQFPGIATGGSSSFVVDEKGYVVSGYSGGLSNVTKEVWQYNPASDQWQKMEDFPGAARRFTIGFSINNRGYFGSGTNGINFNDLWAYDNFLGQQELEKTIACTIYPNPFVDAIHVTIDNVLNQQVKTVTVYNTEGQFICATSFTENDGTLPLDELPKGSYFLTISVDKKIIHVTSLMK
jgi:N-acetylneuraminic acid mutarotase